jgi:hypothetical protein
MLENNKHYDARISGFGSGLAKATGKAYFFIDFDINGHGLRWIGSPIKQDGSLNTMFTTQLAAAGFDASRYTLSDIAAGPGRGVLNESGTVKIRAVNKLNGRGEMEWSVGWIGEPKTLTKEELAKGLPQDIDAMIRAAAPKAVRPIGEDIPF